MAPIIIPIIQGMHFVLIYC